MSDRRTLSSRIPLRDVIEGRATAQEYVVTLKADVDARLATDRERRREVIGAIGDWEVSGVRPYWWGRRKSVNVWAWRGLWLLCALNAFAGIEHIVRWISG